MKQYLYFILLLLGFSTTSLLGMDASVSFATFKSPSQSFIEIYLHIAGQTVAFAEVQDSNQQAKVEVLILFKQKEEVIKFDKYKLNSPLSKWPIDFIDQKRYALENGDYELVIQVKDLQRPDNFNEYKTNISLDYSNDQLQQSDIQLLASVKKEDSKSPFVKNGFYMEPLPYNFYGRNSETLLFYNEIYNADQVLQEDFLVSYSIEKLLNEEPELVMIAHKRQQPTEYIPILQKMDITRLRSGNYNLVVEVRDRTKKLLSKKTIFFQRSNPYLDSDLDDLASVDVNEEFVKDLTPKDLDMSLRAITPHLPPRDVELVDHLLKKDSIRAQRLYLFSFWVQRNPNNPRQAYDNYMEIAKAVGERFKSGFRYGFETDRGRIYLKYGAPDDIENRENEPSAPPYEVWSYNDFPQTNQGIVKFIFYNPSLAAGDYILLHSNARGELSNPQWQRQLYRNAPGEIDNGDPLGNGMQDNIGRHGERVFRDY